MMTMLIMMINDDHDHNDDSENQSSTGLPIKTHRQELDENKDHKDNNISHYGN